MTIKPWKILESKHLRKEIRLDTCELPNGKIIDGVVLEYGDWATIVALTKEQQVVLVWQYRHGAQKVILELPGGARRTFLEDGDSLAMRGWCQGDGYRVGFGEVEGTIVAAG